MRVIRSILAGAAVGVVAALVSLIAEFVLTAQVSGSAHLGTVSGDAVYFPFAALAGFALGFFWQFRRSGRA